MELALLFFLLPVAALSGWWVGRRASHNSGVPGASGLSANYFKGLNFLLNEQPDKAIDVFVKMLEVDSETVETHIALGNLFRRRGEVDRAIRIHQNLIARPSLHKTQRALALYELGQDYMRAGLLGRAETLFSELLDQGEFRAEALQNLLEIYQQEKDWEKAIIAARRLEHLSGKKVSVLVAQFYCELAEALRSKGESKAALKLLKQALAADRQCVRANLLRAAIEQQAGHYKAAIKFLKQVEQQDSRYLSEVVGPLVACYQALGKTAEAERYLGELLERHDGITPLLALVELLQQHAGDRVAAERVVAFLRKRPSVRGLDRLIELHLAGSEGAARDNLMILKELTRGLLEGRATYRCGHCGFKGKTLRWQCPGCKEWGSILPIQGVVGE